MSIGIRGDVYPGGPETVFPQPEFNAGDALYDQDTDNQVPWMIANGNQMDLRFIDRDDPQGTVTQGGLLWNNIDVWVGYETADDVEIGRVSRGVVSVTAGGALRWQDFLLGVASTGRGLLIVSGAGSVVNNDYTLLPSWARWALALAKGDIPSGSGQTTEAVKAALDAVSTSDIGPASAEGLNLNARPAGDYDLRVGIAGTGRVHIENGGGVEVRNKLTIAEQEDSGGLVTVTGFGSFLYVSGSAEQSVVYPGGKLSIEDDAELYFGRGLKLARVATAAEYAAIVAANQAALDADPNATLQPLPHRSGSAQMEVLEGDSTLQGALTIESGAVLRVGPEASLTVTGRLTNNGTILLDGGAELTRAGGAAGGGKLLRAKCGRPTIIDGTVDDRLTA